MCMLPPALQNVLRRLLDEWKETDDEVGKLMSTVFTFFKVLLRACHPLILILGLYARLSLQVDL